MGPNNSKTIHCGISVISHSVHQALTVSRDQRSVSFGTTELYPLSSLAWRGVQIRLVAPSPKHRNLNPLARGENLNTDVWTVSTVETGMALYTANTQFHSSSGPDVKDATAGNHLTLSPEITRSLYSSGNARGRNDLKSEV